MFKVLKNQIRLAFLSRGMTIALFQQAGTLPSRKDKFTINVIIGAK